VSARGKIQSDSLENGESARKFIEISMKNRYGAAIKILEKNTIEWRLISNCTTTQAQAERGFLSAGIKTGGGLGGGRGKKRA
jgi:hypothetical protein